MDGVTDATMRSLQGELGGFCFVVSEFVRVTREALPAKVFYRDIPELYSGGATATGLPVQIQILGGEPEPMAASALVACKLGARAIDINFGCPAPTVNRHDGGASLLRYPQRIRAIVAAVRAAVPPQIPVSAKLRLGWDSSDSIDENAAMAAEGGANWLTIHARTKVQGYRPPVDWKAVGRVQAALNLPIVANGDIWTLDDFRRCQDQTGCQHFMLGRGALADPRLPWNISRELGLVTGQPPTSRDWDFVLAGLARHSLQFGNAQTQSSGTLARLKQWIRLAHTFGDFDKFDVLKRSTTLAEFFQGLNSTQSVSHPSPKFDEQTDAKEIGSSHLPA